MCFGLRDIVILCNLLRVVSIMTIKVHCLLFSYRSPHLQLTDDKRHSEVFMNHSAPNINQCNDSSKHYLTRSTTQNACEWRILRDDSLQGFDADFREQSPWLKYALNSMPLNQHIDTGNPGSVLDTCKKRFNRKMIWSLKDGLFNDYLHSSPIRFFKQLSLAL